MIYLRCLRLRSALDHFSIWAPPTFARWNKGICRLLPGCRKSSFVSSNHFRCLRDLCFVDLSSGKCRGSGKISRSLESPNSPIWRVRSSCRRDRTSQDEVRANCEKIFCAEAPEMSFLRRKLFSSLWIPPKGNGLSNGMSHSRTSMIRCHVQRFRVVIFKKVRREKTRFRQIWLNCFLPLLRTQKNLRTSKRSNVSKISIETEKFCRRRFSGKERRTEGGRRWWRHAGLDWKIIIG